jgi:uncharacterized membrane protein YfcA
MIETLLIFLLGVMVGGLGSILGIGGGVLLIPVLTGVFGFGTADFDRNSHPQGTGTLIVFLSERDWNNAGITFLVAVIMLLSVLLGKS